MNFLRDRKGLSTPDAYSLASIGIDFRIAEAVDAVQVVYGAIPKKDIQEQSGLLDPEVKPLSPPAMLCRPAHAGALPCPVVWQARHRKAIRASLSGRGTCANAS